MVDKCPICGGTGLNYAAKQEWGIPVALTPKCHYCSAARDVLEVEDAGQELLDRLRRLQAVAEMAKGVVRMVDDAFGAKEAKTFPAVAGAVEALREALFFLEAGPEGKDDAG